MRRSLDEIKHLDFLQGLHGVLNDSHYRGPEADVIMGMLPDDLIESWSSMVEDLVADANEMTDSELEQLIRQLPAGYLRMEVRTILRSRIHS